MDPIGPGTPRTGYTEGETNTVDVDNLAGPRPNERGAGSYTPLAPRLLGFVRYARRVKMRWAILRWACTLGFVALLTMYLLNLRWHFWFERVEPSGFRGWGASEGGMQYFRRERERLDPPPGPWTFECHNGQAWEGLEFRFRFKKEGRNPPPGLRIHATNVAYTWLFVPYWLPGLLLAGPALLLWRRQIVAAWVFCRNHVSSHRPGVCPHCNYTLTGLPSGSSCPECRRGPKP